MEEGAGGEGEGGRWEEESGVEEVDLLLEDLQHSSSSSSSEEEGSEEGE